MLDRLYIYHVYYMYMAAPFSDHSLKESHMTKLMKVNPLIDPEGAQSGSAS